LVNQLLGWRATPVCQSLGQFSSSSHSFSQSVTHPSNKTFFRATFSQRSNPVTTITILTHHKHITIKDKKDFFKLQIVLKLSHGNMYTQGIIKDEAADLCAAGPALI
jgi:hypothetical protein